MNKKVFFTVLGTIVVLLSAVAVVFSTHNASRREDPVEKAINSDVVYSEEGYILYPSEDGSYYIFSGVSDFEGTELIIPAYYNGLPIKKLESGAINAAHGGKVKRVIIPDTVDEIMIRLYPDILDQYPIEFNEYENGYYLGSDENPFHALMLYSADEGTHALLHKDTKVIASGAFMDCNQIDSVTLPEGLLSIGTQAFLRCISLKQVTVPDSVTYVGDYTFSQCHSLENAVLGSGITELVYRMFAECYSLKTLEIRGKITKIAKQALKSCNSLISFEIPASVTEIGNSAFEDCAGLYNVTVHKGILSLGGGVFPKSIKYNEYKGGLYIGNDANPYLYLVSTTDLQSENFVVHKDTFSIAEQLLNLNRNIKTLAVDEESGRYLRSEGNCIIRKEDKVLLCGISNSVIPSKGVTEIAPYAFAYTSIESAVIPNSVKKIGTRAFAYCSSLSSVSFGKNVEEIGEAAFITCDSLESISLPAGLYEIPNVCFYRCTALREINISEKTEVIGENVFFKCSSLQSITLPGVKVIGNEAFSDCKMLEKVSVSKDLGYIGDNSFADCSALKDIVLPYGVRYIGYHAFYNCDSLKFLNIPKSIEKFKGGVFHHCNSLEYAVIPEGVTDLSRIEFECCTSLKRVSLPSTLKSIVYAAFAVCESLEEIVYNGTVDEWNSIEKAEKWYIEAPAFRVICTDGEVEYPANESKYTGSW
ncbi:MAG: leucine-rich repeat domain-containing protein [Clostridia bacterium]|nr:leucine-rich repeat domain-containing protein [Clostridia bacterium]